MPSRARARRHPKDPPDEIPVPRSASTRARRAKTPPPVALVTRNAAALLDPHHEVNCGAITAVPLVAMDAIPPHMVPNTTERAVWMVSVSKYHFCGRNLKRCYCKLYCSTLVRLSRSLARLQINDAQVLSNGLNPEEALAATGAPCGLSTASQ